MARPLAIVAILLSALPEGFVLASLNVCSDTPYAALGNYEPANEWCSSYIQDTLPTATALVNLPTQCVEGDALCSMFSNLQAASSKILSSFWFVLFH